MSDIINLDKSQYKDIDTNNEEIEQIKEENEVTYEDIKLIIILINRILNVNVISLPMYSSNYAFRFKEQKEKELDELYRIKQVLEIYKEEKTNEDDNNKSDFLKDINGLFKDEDKNKKELDVEFNNKLKEVEEKIKVYKK